MPRDRAGACRRRRIRRTKEAARASPDIDTARRERPPRTRARGPHGPRRTGVVHAPLSVHRLGAHIGGRHTAPSDRDDDGACNLHCRLTLAARTSPSRHRAARMASSLVFATMGTSSLPALVPLSGGRAMGNQGKRHRVQTSGLTLIGTPCVVRSCNYDGRTSRSVRRALRRRRPGGRGGGTAVR